MNQGAVMAGITLVAALMSVGCASGPSAAEQKRIGATAVQMCQAHGGSYNATTRTCTYTPTTKSMREACAAMGGAFDDAADYCDMDRR